MISRAQLKYLGVSAQKTRLVVDQVRGKSVDEARSLLMYSRKLVAKDLRKLLMSAVANAQQKDQKLDEDQLVISRAVVNEGPQQKRIRHRSMGRVYRIIKRTCHVTIELDQRAGGR
jgi:large subunit ribosomal protein L22